MIDKQYQKVHPIHTDNNSEGHETVTTVFHDGAPRKKLKLPGLRGVGQQADIIACMYSPREDSGSERSVMSGTFCMPCWGQPATDGTQ